MGVAEKGCIVVSVVAEKGRPFILGLDLDGVTAEYNAGFTQLVADYLQREVETLPPPQQWDYTHWGITVDDYMELHNRAVEDGLFRLLDPVAGAVETLQRLDDEGVHIRIVTHRILTSGSHVRVVTDTVEWLDKHRIPYWDLCFVRAKQQIEADLFLDDAPHNLKNLSEAGYTVAAFDMPYNQGFPGLRAYSWDDVYEIVNTLRNA